MVDGGLKTYRHYREYSEEEIRDEYSEYFENDYTSEAMPELFADEDDMSNFIKDSELTTLSPDDLAKIKNADIGEILGYSNKGLRLSACIKLMKHYGRDWKRLLDGFVNRKKLPPPLVIRDKDNNLWLMAGNSRMMMGAALGFNIPVKIRDYKEVFVTEGFKMNKSDMIDIAKEIVKMHGLKSKVVIDRSNNKADYEWISDTISINPRQDSIEDFVESILHECDHALMRKKMGAEGYETAYTIAGQKVVDQGKDFYWDNPFEKQAEKYAEKNAKKYIKKIQPFLN
jgi:hypothetical protein